MRNVSVKSRRENQNTHFTFNSFLFRKSCRLWDNVEKYFTARRATHHHIIRCRRFAYLDNDGYRHTSSSSIGSATLVGFGLLNYRWVFSAGRFLQNVVASGTSNPPTWRTSDLERSNSRHKMSETTQANPSSGRWKYGREIAENLAESGDFHVTFGFCRKFTTCDRRFYFPSEGRRAEDFFARKIRRLRPGLNPRTRVPKASTLTSKPPKPPQTHTQNK